MKFNKFKPCALNEAFFNDNMDKEVTAVAPPVYADAVEEHKARKEKLKDDFNQVITDTKKFVDDNHNREKKIGGSKEMKKMHLSESLFEDVVEEPVKKRTRSENEKKERRDYSSEDLWLAVYDELSATTDNEGAGQQVDKQIKARRGERYEHVYPHGDSDIVIYATKPEEFEFAKKVADHYGVIAEEPKEDKNKNTNGFYRYSMIIRIPEEDLYSED